jgi:YegS/Rv2252/BmrU family lipid kinase
MLKTKTVHIILNASSGLDEKKTDAPATLRRILTEGGLEADIHHIDKSTDLCELAREMVRCGAETVVAAGGDGTINAVASVLAGTDVTLGVIPAGTLNHFARDLRIPIDIAAAAKIIVQGRTAQVDVGEVNGRRFINNAIIGLYPIYRFQRERNEKRGRHKFLAMTSAVLSVFRLNPGLHVSLEAEGKAVNRKTPFLMVANNRHEMEGYRLGNRESISTGLLCVYVMHHMSRFRMALLGLSVLLGRFSKSKDFDVLSAREVKLEGRRKHIRISLDGEIVKMDLPLQYRSLPSSLRVIVPETYNSRN